jgi:hypothetical protein
MFQFMSASVLASLFSGICLASAEVPNYCTGQEDNTGLYANRLASDASTRIVTGCLVYTDKVVLVQCQGDDQVQVRQLPVQFDATVTSFQYFQSLYTHDFNDYDSQTLPNPPDHNAVEYFLYGGWFGDGTPSDVLLYSRNDDQEVWMNNPDLVSKTRDFLDLNCDR